MPSGSRGRPRQPPSAGSDPTISPWSEKGDGTPVTQADRAAEAHLRAAVADAFPDDGVSGEEEAERIGTSGRRWIVDPIDGTKAFTRGVPLYSTLLAVEDEHGLAVGVIVAPRAGRDRVGRTGSRLLRTTASGPGQPDRRCRRRLLTTSGYTHWPEPMLLGARRSGAAAADVGRRLRLRPRRHRPGRGHGRPGGRALRPSADAAPPRRGRRALHRPRRRRGYAGGSGLGTNGLLHDEVLATPHNQPAFLKRRYRQQQISDGDRRARAGSAYSHRSSGMWSKFMP